MTYKFVLLLLFFISFFNHSISHTLRERRDLDNSEIDDEEINLSNESENNDDSSINLSDEFHNSDDQSLDDVSLEDEQQIFDGAQLKYSEYEDFYDIEKSAHIGTEMDDEGGTGLLDESSRWPQVGDKIVVPFEIDKYSGYTKRQQKNIVSAMREIQSKTCIKFIKRGYERNFITFKSNSRELTIN